MLGALPVVPPVKPTTLGLERPCIRSRSHGMKSSRNVIRCTRDVTALRLRNADRNGQTVESDQELWLDRRGWPCPDRLSDRGNVEAGRKRSNGFTGKPMAFVRG